MTSLHRRPLFAPPRIELFINSAQQMELDLSPTYRVAQLRIPVRSRAIEQLSPLKAPAPDAPPPTPLLAALDQRLRLEDIERGGEAPWPEWMNRWAKQNRAQQVLVLQWPNHTWRRFIGMRAPFVWVDISAARRPLGWHTVCVDVLMSQHGVPQEFGSRRSNVVLLDLVPVELSGA